MTEQAREELQILLDRERGIEVLAQPLRHVGDARAHPLAMSLAGHVATQHLDRALLDDAYTGQQREQTGLAYAVGPDQADHPSSGNVQVDAIQGNDVAVTQAYLTDACNGRGLRTVAHTLLRHA